MKSGCIQIREKMLVYLFLCLMVISLSACGDSESSAGESNQENGTEEDVLSGQWQDDSGKIFLDIWRDDAGVWYGSISREDSLDAVTFWDFSGRADQNVFSYQNAVKTYAVYDSEGESQDTEYYSDGTGKITYKDGNLYWQDDKEDAGADLIFSYVGEY